MSEPVVEVKDLTKRYGRIEAVAGLDLTVEPGEVFGLLGPNGSGKTTIILILLGLTEPTSGSVQVLGLDPLRKPLEVKRAVGYLPDSVGFYDQMTARENLHYTARLMGLEYEDAKARIEKALERVGLAEAVDRKLGAFSHGMRQRLGVAEILVKDCQVAILDEPTNGLDPQSTRELLALIKELRDDGRTIVLSSHTLSLVQSICDRVALIYRGQIGLTGDVDSLCARVLGGSYVIEVEAADVDFAHAFGDLDGVTRVTPAGKHVVHIHAQADLRPAIAARVTSGGGHLMRLNMHQPSLEDVYARYFEEMSHAA